MDWAGERGRAWKQLEYEKLWVDRAVRPELSPFVMKHMSCLLAWKFRLELICQDWAWEGFPIVISITLSFGVLLWEDRLKLFPC